jgi:peptidoglycan/LPS O-acetylase OafA/YrhL
MPERHLQFRPDIEGLRAVAILLVVFYHAGWQGTRSGFLGVDVFFVLSGFLITGLLLDEVVATGRVSLTQFWARRARRLLVAAALVTVVVLLAGAAILTPFDQKSLAETARAFAVYGSNILFAVRSTEYFGADALRDPLLHTWSLSVEEQFYLLFAPAMLIMATWARSRGPDVFRRRFGWTVALVTLASFAGCLFLARRYPVVAFYALPARAWEFGLGALAVLGARRLAARSAPPALEVLAASGIAAMLFAAYLRAPATPAPGVTTLLPTLATVALLVAGAGTYQTWVARGLATPPMRLLGRLSYSWYLWHWPALVFLRELVPRPSLRLSLAVAALSLVPAAIAYAFVESPVRFSVKLKPMAKQSVAGAVVLAMLLVLAATGLLRRADSTLATPRYALIAAAKRLPRVYADGCQIELPIIESPACRYGPARNDTTVVLFGDSHAAQWFPAMDSLAALRGWSLVNLTKTACPVPAIVVVNGQLGRRYFECEEWRRNSIARIVALHPTIVVTASAKSYNVMVGEQRLRTDASASARRVWRDGLVRSLSSLAASGARLVVLEDTPRMPFDVPRCLVKNLDAPARCSTDSRRAIDTTVAAVERDAARSFSGVTYVSLNSQICDTLCLVVRDGIVRYQDSNHLSVRYAATLTSAVSEKLTELLPGRVAAIPRFTSAANAHRNAPAPRRRGGTPTHL